MVCGLSQVSLANCNKVLALRGKKRLVADCRCCATEPSTYLPSQVRSLQMRTNEKFHFTPILYNPVGADPNLRGYTNYLPVTRETTKLVSSNQMRSSHCS